MSLALFFKLIKQVIREIVVDVWITKNVLNGLKCTNHKIERV